MGDVRNLNNEAPDMLAVMEMMRQFDSIEHRYVLMKCAGNRCGKRLKKLLNFLKGNAQAFQLNLEYVLTIADVIIIDYLVITDIPVLIDI